MAACRKLKPKQVKWIDHHLEKYGVSVDMENSFYESTIWQISIKKHTTRPCIMSKLADIIMKDLEVKDIILNGVVYHS